MEKSTFTPHYEALRETLVEMREEAGLSQRALAEKLGRERSFVGRIELGERRLDLVEFFWVCQACERNAADVASDIMRRFAKLERRRKRKK